MPENFDAYWTIEVNGSKGWEVIWTSFDRPTESEISYRLWPDRDNYQIRITSPVPESDADAA